GIRAPVAQPDRALPSEGRGHTFESCRVRHLQHLSLPIFGIFSAESVSKGLRFRVISAHFDGRHRCPPRASGTRAPPSATRPAPRPTILTISKRNDERA